MHFHASLHTESHKASLILTHVTIKHCLHCVECTKMAQQEIQCETVNSNGLVLRQNKIIFTYLDKVYETF